jgi:hypothetical protein
MGKSSASGRIMHPLEFAKAELCFKCVANQITANNAQTENKGVGVQAFTYFLALGKFEQDRREEASPAFTMSVIDSAGFSSESVLASASSRASRRAPATAAGEQRRHLALPMTVTRLCLRLCRSFPLFGRGVD